MKTRVLNVASNFTSRPLEPSLRSSLLTAGSADGVRFYQYAQMSEHMLGFVADFTDNVGTLILLRVEDWLRDDLKLRSFDSVDDPGRLRFRRVLRERLDEFVGQIETLSRRARQVWFVACPSTGWICERHKLAALFQAYTNLAVARVRSLPHVTTLSWPTALFAKEISDRSSDRLGQIPFTQEAFDRLGRFLGDQIERWLIRKTPDGQPEISSRSYAELAAYLVSLRVQVRITRACREDRASMDRLLRDAAGFSLVGENRDLRDSEIDDLLESNGCMLVRVSDRLSDYGPSGIVAFHVAEEALIVDSMVLSCTVLGKQVEHAILSALAQIATARHLAKLVFTYRPSGRNGPILTFLQSVADRESDTRYVLPVDITRVRIEAAAVSFGAWVVEGRLR
jgi:hypothetical protein